ncbi:MAG: TlpA family protein disulfide reductase, partial [Candidatus Cloacimonetes bacterium]|nr:TlpA family protein disulfide reductase [Candidatus Cloacimonadota bacterium]
AKDKVIKTVRSLKLDMITTIDANKSIQKSFNVKEIPETFVINQEGEITFHHNGYIPGDEDKLEEELKKLLKGSK